MKAMSRNRKRTGFSLVEILVTIVIFTVGILALVQIYPAGLGILRTTKNNTVAINLARAHTEALKVNLEQLPEAILPTRYVWNAGMWITEIDLDRPPSNITPIGTALAQNGVLSDLSGNYGPWAQFSGANTARRVIGEGKRVPAPRFVPVGAGTRYGGLMTLQFAPVLSPDPNPIYRSTFVVYGNDLVRAFPDAVPAGFPVRNDFTVFIDEDGLEMTLPQGPYRAFNPTAERLFRVSAAVRYTDAGNNIVRRVFVGVVVSVPQAASGTQPVNYSFDLATLFATPGLAFVNVEPDTVRVQRAFERTATFMTEAQVGNDERLKADAAYQYDLLDSRLGVMIFNPIGANYQERRNRGRFPLTARVDYDVLDWRNIRDDFRIPQSGPFQQKLILDTVKVIGNRYADGLPYQGVEVPVPNGTGGTQQLDFVLVDQETGGIFDPSTYSVDKSLGIVTFVGANLDPSGSVSGRIFFSGQTAPTLVQDIRGRSVRAIYQAAGEIASQILKATSVYYPTESATLGYAQCYVGGSNINVLNDVDTRLYFPLSDIGKKVIVGEVWYGDGSGIPRRLAEQEYRIEAPKAGEWGAMAYIDIREKAPAALGFDFSRGYAVQRVRGASVQVKVHWNPTFFTLVNDTGENMNRLGTWLSQTRTVQTESFLMRGNIE